LINESLVVIGLEDKNKNKWGGDEDWLLRSEKVWGRNEYWGPYPSNFMHDTC